MRECISHHLACDCREAEREKELEELRTALESMQGLYELAMEQAKENEHLAEIRGAAWACDWYWSNGLRHHNANPAAICNDARERERRNNEYSTGKSQ